MIALALGLAALAALFWAARAFSRASVASVKALLAWVAALAGLSLAALLFLTGRGPVAVSGLALAGPLLLNYWRQNRVRGAGGGRPRMGRMDRREALEVLGLQEGASDSDIRAAWVRVMRGAHPDSGGSDWLASRANQARDVLLNRR